MLRFLRRRPRLLTALPRLSSRPEGVPVTEQAAPRRVGMVAVVGRPNVGKSTLVNALVGERVSITSRKPQTTRDRVLGVRTDDTAQYIFVDTPGFQRRHRSALNRRMNEKVTGALSEVDAVVLVIEATGWRPEDDEVVRLLPAASDRVILAINKSDTIAERERLLPLMAESMRRFPFRAIVPVSAEKGRQLDDLLKEIAPLLPEGMPLFDADQYTDRSVRFLAAEQIREKAYRLLGDELPYGIAVTIDRWDEDEGGAAIVATLVVDREAHKPIVIGKDGAKLREISRLARADIAEMLGKRVHLEVWVRVKRGWSDDARAMRTLGYE
jgi:GTP-binding protein Era